VKDGYAIVLTCGLSNIKDLLCFFSGYSSQAVYHEGPCAPGYDLAAAFVISATLIFISIWWQVGIRRPTVMRVRWADARIFSTRGSPF